jgi:hypothetical protein
MDNLPESSNPLPPVYNKPVKKNSAWWPLILILVGVILLVQNLHIANFTFHWWALFIFIPVFGSLNSAWNHYRSSGRFTASVLSSLGSAIVVGAVAVILMFGLDWAHLWPVMVIAVGLSMFFSGLSGLDPQANKHVTPWMGVTSWVGLAAMVLGFGFLIKYMPIPSLQPYLEGFRWWAIPILVAGLGILLTGFILIGRNQWSINWEAWSLLLIALFTLATGVMALFKLDWNLLFPIVLIACGVMILAGIFRKR